MSSEPESVGGVTIGAREIYDAVVSLRSDVQSLAQTHVATDEKLKDHEERLRGLERWRYALPVSAVTSAGALAFSLLKGTGMV